MKPPTNKGTVGNSIYTFKKSSKIGGPLVSVNSWVACMAPCMCTTVVYIGLFDGPLAVGTCRWKFLSYPS